LSDRDPDFKRNVMQCKIFGNAPKLKKN